MELRISSVCVGAFESFTGGSACLPFPCIARCGEGLWGHLSFAATLPFLSRAEFTSTGLSYFTSEFRGGIMATSP